MAANHVISTVGGHPARHPKGASVRTWARAGRAGALVLSVAFWALGCDEKSGAETESVQLNRTWFHLECASDDATRVKGLGERDYIAPDGGMLFVFPHPIRGAFVMRDCPVAIDVAFLDQAGRVLTIHEMTPEPPRGPGEGKPGETNAKYEARLRQYPSRYPAQFAIETAGGRLAQTGLKEGDVVDLDLDRLKRLAR